MTDRQGDAHRPGAGRAVSRVMGGTRGEGWVVGQMGLLLVYGAASFVGPPLPAWARGSARWIGVAGMLSGAPLALSGIVSLGRNLSNLTPFPRPNADSTLVQTGAYRWVRHPLYGGVVLLALGGALVRGRWLAVIAATILLAFFDAKASREELWLTERFAQYPAYRRWVPKLIPGLY